MNSCQYYFATCLLRIKCFCTLLLRAVLFHQLMGGCQHVGDTHPWCVNHALDSKQLCKAWQAGIGPSRPQEYLDPQHQRASIVSQGAVPNEGCFIYPQAGNSGSSRYGDKMSPVQECSCLAIDPWWHSTLEWKATQLVQSQKKSKVKVMQWAPIPNKQVNSYAGMRAIVKLCCVVAQSRIFECFWCSSCSSRLLRTWKLETSEPSSLSSTSTPFARTEEGIPQHSALLWHCYFILWEAAQPTKHWAKGYVRYVRRSKPSGAIR